MDEERWRAVVKNDSSYDGRFYYGVLTTGIVCRPSCRSRLPSREHVRFFASLEEAAAFGLRPCKRCRPDSARPPEEELAERAARLIEQRYRGPLTLELVAASIHASPYHLHRTFKKVCGITPVAYIQHMRIEAAKRLLEQTQLAVSEVAWQSGFGSAAHFAAVFHKKTGVTPTAYRQQHGIQD